MATQSYWDVHHGTRCLCSPSRENGDVWSHLTIGLTSLVGGLLPANAMVTEALDEQSLEIAPMAQVNSVSQLSDVKPTDWAFQALQSLVERYGCITGYLDKTYRGNRALTRYEFAAGLSTCTERINHLIALSTADLVKKEDLETFSKFLEEFAAELTTLRGRIDAIANLAMLKRMLYFTTMCSRCLKKEARLAHDLAELEKKDYYGTSRYK